MDGWWPIVEIARLSEGRGQVVEVHGKTLAVFLVDGQPHVLDNTCPHREGDLGAGDVLNGMVYCPLHAWPFELRSGRCPTHHGAQVRVYPCRIQEGELEARLALDDEAAAV